VRFYRNTRVNAFNVGSYRVITTLMSCHS